MAKLYTYMIGIEPKYWTKDDDYACENYDIENKGYYQLGDNEGMILVGKLNDLKDIMDEYFGLEIVDDFLCPYESFDWEDGKWITGGWNESKKSFEESNKNLKEIFYLDSYITAPSGTRDLLFTCKVTKIGNKFYYSDIEGTDDLEGEYNNRKNFIADIEYYLDSNQGQEEMERVYKERKRSGEIEFEESKKSAKKSLKESRETFKFNFPNNKEVLSFLKPMEYGLTSAQLMTDTGGNWAKIEDPIFEESGYMYIKNKQSNSYIKYEFAKVINVDIDWGNYQIYFYTKGDVLMLHFYHLSDEEFKFLIYGDDNLDGLATRFGK